MEKNLEQKQGTGQLEEIINEIQKIVEIIDETADWYLLCVIFKKKGKIYIARSGDISISEVPQVIKEVTNTIQERDGVAKQVLNLCIDTDKNKEGE